MKFAGSEKLKKNLKKKFVKWHDSFPGRLDGHVRTYDQHTVLNMTWYVSMRVKFCQIDAEKKLSNERMMKFEFVSFS